MKKITLHFVLVCHFMHESEIIEPLPAVVDYSAGYSTPEVYFDTATAVLYRVRKAGKYFMIKTPKDATGQALAMLQREYEISLRIAHPHIASVFTYEPATVVGPGIVMEYVDGRTLADFLAENPSKAMRERVFVQLLQAVAYMHRCGVVHNDIKPGNILVTRADNDVRLIDFGLADNDAHYLARTMGCTPAYASPELLAREKDIDARSDIYSLGVIMREIFGSSYSRVASRCMCGQRDKRYANVEELLRAFTRPRRSANIITAVLLALLLLIPALYYGHSYLENSRKISRRHSMIAQIETDVRSMYEVISDSLHNAPYYEFALNHILSFYDVMGKYQVANVTSVADPELNALLSSVYMRNLQHYQDTLWAKAGALPSLYKCELPIEAIVYYDSLVSHRLPFVPFK